MTLSRKKMEKYASNLVAQLCPEGEIVEKWWDEDSFVLKIDDPEDPYELAVLWVYPNLSWNWS